MKIQLFEEIQAWALARKLTRKVYDLTKKPEFSKDFGRKKQIRDAAGSSMHTIVKISILSQMQSLFFFRGDAKRSCTEVQSELYVALDEKYVSLDEFKETYELAGRTRAAIRGFINYLSKYEKQKVSNLER